MKRAVPGGGSHARLPAHGRHTTVLGSPWGRSQRDLHIIQRKEQRRDILRHRLDEVAYLDLQAREEHVHEHEGATYAHRVVDPPLVGLRSRENDELEERDEQPEDDLKDRARRREYRREADQADLGNQQQLEGIEVGLKVREEKGYRLRQVRGVLIQDDVSTAAQQHSKDEKLAERVEGEAQPRGASDLAPAGRDRLSVEAIVAQVVATLFWLADADSVIRFEVTAVLVEALVQESARRK